MNITTANSGAVALARIAVTPFLRENLPVRATFVKAADPDGNKFAVTGARLRTIHLMALEDVGVAGTDWSFTAGAKDTNDVWSEWSDSSTVTLANLSAGTSQRSIGSGQTSAVLVEEPGMLFPDLSVGSGAMMISRTVVDEGFFDESRRSKWPTRRAAFHVVLKDLDGVQVQLMHKFFRQLNGPFKPFYFEFTNPKDKTTRKYVVRFRDPSLADELFAVDGVGGGRSSFEFVLVEVIGASTGEV